MMISASVLTGLGIGLGITLVLALFFGFGFKDKGLSGLALVLFRIGAEVALIAGFIAAFIAAAVIGTAAAWELFLAYAAVRVIALGIEFAIAKN